MGASLNFYHSKKVLPDSNVLETVKGTVPGLNIGATNKAGQEPGMSIRGQNSTSGNKPLIVVDGAIYDGSLADIPSSDIETFTVLKDASAAAVYGSRSSNGVVLVQTKRGRSVGRKPDFNVNFSYGITNELKSINVFNREDYLQRILDIRASQGIEADRNNIQNYMTAEQAKKLHCHPGSQTY